MSLKEASWRPRQGTTDHNPKRLRRVGTMTTVHRLKIAGAFLALAGAIVCTQVWGDASGRRKSQPTNARTDAGEGGLGERLVTDKFAGSPVVAYTTSKGETLVAVQLKPTLEAPPARPRDLAIIIDASASQAGSAYTMARSICKALDGALSPTDR